MPNTPKTGWFVRYYDSANEVYLYWSDAGWTGLNYATPYSLPVARVKLADALVRNRFLDAEDRIQPELIGI